MGLDYKTIINNLQDANVFQLLTELGGEPIDKGAFILSKTICHNHDTSEASYKLYYYKNTHIFMCYSECATMSIFKMLKNYYEARNITYDWYQDILNVIISCAPSQTVEGFTAKPYESIKDRYVQRKDRKELIVYPDKILDVFIKKYPLEWERDGITRAAMDKYNIRFSISQNKIIIPHYNVFGQLVGIRGRALNEWEIENIGKYMPVQIEQKWYSHPLSLNLYGLNKNYTNIKKYQIAYVFESEKACLQCEAFSFPNCSVAVCGSQFNKFQLDLLVRYCHPQEIVICFDKEEKSGEDKYFKKLYDMCKKYTNYARMSFCYDRQGLSKMKDSPSDNGQIIFEQLLKGRVRVK
jgi:hypothetical protein